LVNKDSKLEIKSARILIPNKCAVWGNYRVILAIGVQFQPGEIKKNRSRTGLADALNDLIWHLASIEALNDLNGSFN